MKKLFIALSALAVVLAGCGQEQTVGGNVSPEPAVEPAYEGTVAIGADSYTLGETVVYENVTVVPLISKSYDPQQEADYITLAEASKNDWIEIVEKPGAETVSELTVRYNGPKPLLLLAGELLLGGKQDRVVAKDTVIDPISTVVVAVFCVEPGRWTSGASSFGYSGTQVPSSVKRSALRGNQNDVWEETGEFNSIAGASASARSTVDTGMKSKEVVEFSEKGKEGLRPSIEGNESVVGLLFIINGEIHSLEIFGAPRLLESSFDSIISGILAEASVRQEIDFDMPSDEALLAFLNDVYLVHNEALSTSGFSTNGVVSLERLQRGIGGAMIQGDSEDVGIAHGSFYNDKD